jgi:putative cell wall-binding protein
LVRKSLLVLLLGVAILSGYGSLEASAHSSSVSVAADDDSVKMDKIEFGKYSSGVIQGVWDPNEKVDRFVFYAGEEGLYGNIYFKMNRSWDRSLDNTKLENTLYAELKNGQYIKLFFDPGTDDKTYIGAGAGLYKNEEVEAHGGIEQLTGKYIFETKRMSNLEKEYTYDITFEFTERYNVIRYGGKDRYEVEKNLNSEIPDHSLDAVLVTSGLKYSDTLVGSILNRTENATVLLITDNDAIIKSKIAEAKRLLKPSGKVYILGGPGTVSTTIESKLKKNFPVERIGGKDRLEVALKVAEKANPAPTELFLVYGLVFSDALSVSPAATERLAPILPQWGTSLKAEIKAYIKKHPTIKKVYVVSGTGVIPVSVESELKALGISSVERVAGKDRYDTSLAIAQKFHPKARAGSLASGTVFADALSGSRNAWVYSSPILLVKKDYLIIHSLAYVGNMRRVWILGGPATVSDQVTEYYR